MSLEPITWYPGIDGEHPRSGQLSFPFVGSRVYSPGSRQFVEGSLVRFEMDHSFDSPTIASNFPYEEMISYSG